MAVLEFRAHGMEGGSIQVMIGHLEREVAVLRGCRLAAAILAGDERPEFELTATKANGNRHGKNTVWADRKCVPATNVKHRDNCAQTIVQS